MSGKGAAAMGAKGLGGGKGGKSGIGKGEGGKTGGPTDKKKPVSRSVKAGLQFPVGRIHRFLKVSLYSFSSNWCSATPTQRSHATQLCLLHVFMQHILWMFQALLKSLQFAAQARATAGGRVGATAAVYSAAILGMQLESYCHAET